jgi:SAM-dependent methyltransferase
VLDYGCAKGTTLKKLVKQRTDITPYLFDVSDMYLSFWKKFVKEGHWATYSADPHWTGTMDVVTSFFSLEHVASPRSMLSNIWGLLKRNGIFYCIVPDILQNIADFVVIDHVNHFTHSSISYLFSESGFEVLEINTSDHASAMIVIARKCEEVGRLHEVQLSDTERCTITSEVAKMENYWSNLSLRIQNFERGLKESDRFAIYGSGFYGTYIASCLIDQDRFKYFLDRDPYRQKKRLLGKRIIDPELMPEQINTVMVGLNPSVARKNIEMITSWNARDINFFYL